MSDAGHSTGRHNIILISISRQRHNHDRILPRFDMAWIKRVEEKQLKNLGPERTWPGPDMTWTGHDPDRTWPRPDRTWPGPDMTWTWTWTRHGLDQTWPGPDRTWPGPVMAWTGHDLDQTWSGPDMTWAGHDLDRIWPVTWTGHDLDRIDYYVIRRNNRWHLILILYSHEFQ